MGVVKKSNQKKNKNDLKQDVANGKTENIDKVKKKKKVSCLQCIKPAKDDGGLEGKYRVAAPELMQDTFMSDSEDEGGEVECPIQQQQQYRYMNSEAGTLHRAKPLEDSVTDGHRWPSNNDRKVATIDRQPLDIGFLVSFVVDARGGAMKAKRRGGVRIIVPPAACAAPTRVTCRAATRRAPVAAPPPLMEGEALASRLLELQPQGAKFLAPVIIEVPIYTASCKEREIVILRSDTGDTWQDHYLHNNDNPMIQEALQRERLEHGTSGETLGESGERVTRVVTCDFPHYLCVVSRVRQEVHIIGPEGGTVSSAHIPQVQALFPPQALTKRIRVGVQAHGPPADLCRRILPRHVLVSPVITVEPRRRKFHRSITLAAPLPQPQGGAHDKQSTSNLRLLCSIMGGQARAVWEDVTGSTPLTVTDDCASFTTTVSARFWLMNCQNVSDATKLATELYREMLLVPFEVRIVVLGKRLDALEGRLLVLYITDRYAYDTLLQQEHYTEVAHSTAVRFLDGKEVYLEFSGNLVPVTKSGSQPMLSFEAFKDNRAEFTVRVKHHEESPSGRIYFMNDPKVAKGEQGQTPTCVLDVELPERIAPRAGKSQVDYLNLDQSGFDALKDELSFHWGEHNNSTGPGSLPHGTDLRVNGHDLIIANGDVKYPAKPETEDHSTKPQVNGGTLHVDSNKTKATFDSDEDKTPMNTLEKGKKKGDGFFGGIADKVKNVFGHSEDHDDEVKESSPKPQPKPREPKEQKEKSPPKPAPRIINEDLLEKVEDMFKDLHQKPSPKDEEDVKLKVYCTKLVVDEDEKPLHDMKDELYDQYAHMQPVDTPLHCKTEDPFAMYVGCCEGKYKKGEKHRHDNAPSNLTEKIEQANFVLHEQIVNDAKDGLNKLEKEKENIKEKSVEFKDDIIEYAEKLTDDLQIKEEDLKSSFNDQVQNIHSTTQDKFYDIKNSAHKIQDDISNKTSNLHEKMSANIESAQLSAKDTVDQLGNTAASAKEDLTTKYHEVNFAAMERAEALKGAGHEQSVQLERAVNQTSDNLKNKAAAVESDLKNKVHGATDAMSESIHNVEDKLSHKAQDLKSETKDTVDNIKEATNEKIQGINETVNDAKSKAKSKAGKTKDAAKKKSKEGKNFFTGLVNNIFGEKDKIEDEVKGKISEGKEAANELLDQASAKKDELKNSVTKKQDKLKEDTDNLIQNAQTKRDEIEKSIHDKKSEIETSVQNKKNEVEQSLRETKDNALNNLQETKDNFVSTVQNKTDEISKNVNKVANNVQNSFHDKKAELENKSEERDRNIHDKAQETKQSLCDKKDEISSAIHETTDAAKQSLQNKKDEIGKSISETTEDAQQAFQNKSYEIGQAVHDTTEKTKEALANKTEELGNAIQSKKDEVQNAAETQLNRIRHEAELATDEISKTAEDTLNAAADKKAELQSNINNKYDELQQSGKDEWDAIQNTASDKASDIQKSSKQTFDHIQDATLSSFDKVESAAKDKVTDVKDTWEELQSSTRDTYADFRDDVQGLENSAQDTLHSFQSSAGNTFDSLEDSAREFVAGGVQNVDSAGKELFGETKDSFEGFQISADNKLEDVKGAAKDRLEEAGDRLEEVREDVRGAGEAVVDSVTSEADKFTSSLNDLGNSVFGSSGKGFMKDSSTKLLESEKSQSSPHKKGSGIPKLKRKK